MRFCNKKIQKHLLKGGKIERTMGLWYVGFEYTQAIYLDEWLKTCKSENSDEGDHYCLTDEDLATDDWKIIK